MIGLESVEREIEKRRLESDFYAFVLFVFEKIYRKKFYPNWHHKVICSIFEKVRNQQLRHVVINIAPRYSKTEFVNCFVAWCLARQSTDMFMTLSYTSKLAHKNSLGIQNITRSKAYQSYWPTKISEREKGKGLWTTEGGGEIFAGNTGGSITGFGAGRPEDKWGGAMIIDDPQKVDDCSYETKRQHIKDNFDNTLVSRLNNPRVTPIILIMQRIHEDDLTGHVLSDECELDFNHFSYAALKEEETSWGDKREIGEPLWPFKHGASQLKAIEKKRPRYYCGQLQQRPAPEEGLLIQRDWLRFYDSPPSVFDRGVYVSVDMNAKEEGQSNACFSLYGVHGQNVYLLRQLVGKWSFAQAEVYLRKFVPKEYRAILIEEFANGAAMISQLRRHYHGIIPIRPQLSKELRVNEVSVMYTGGNVWYPNPEQNPWVNLHIAEVLTFPRGKNDDRMDAESQMLKFFLLRLGALKVYNQ